MWHPGLLFMILGTHSTTTTTTCERYCECSASESETEKRVKIYNQKNLPIVEMGRHKKRVINLQCFSLMTS